MIILGVVILMEKYVDVMFPFVRCFFRVVAL